jgi:BT1 family
MSTLRAATCRWFVENVVELGREMRLSYLPPLMVYMAAGVSGLTGIVGTFFVKEYLGLSAEFLAALGFWVGIPWAVKMPLGHVVDLIWHHKAGLVYLGAALIAGSLLIMVGLISGPQEMRTIMPIEAWYVLAALLSPIGYVLQDVVADAMTVEAVPRVDSAGHPLDPAQRKLMNTTVQTLGRVAIIGGSVLVALINVYLFRDVQTLSEIQKGQTYQQVYAAALVIPVISVVGVMLADILRRGDAHRLESKGFSREDIHDLLWGRLEETEPNWWILGAGVTFMVFSLGIGLADLVFGQEIIFAGSMSIVLFLMLKLVKDLEPDARRTLLATAIVIFVFRAMPTPGPGVTWWMIDALGFDQQFLSVLSLIASGLTLFGMFVFRRFMAERSITYVVGALTIAGALLALPIIGMYYGLHHWTVALTGGVVDARFIALVDTALESPLGQIAMIPMLAWIANSAPASLKATYFAVMASFTNLALSLGQLGTKYLNQVFAVTREVKDTATGAIKVPADYNDLGALMITASAIGFVLPMLAIGMTKLLRLRSA